MSRTTWFFTLVAVWYAPHASAFTGYMFGVIYSVLAFYSWYREEKHKEVVNV